jgi:hypothetical protein
VIAAAGAAATSFTVPAQPLAFGEHLRLVGSLPELGAWDPEAGLKLDWSDGDNWSAEAALPPGAVEFKVVVIRGDGSAWWEETENRTLEVPEAGDGLAVTCHMGGAGATEVEAAGGGTARAPAAGNPDPAAESPAETATSDDEPASAIDMSVDMDAAHELNPAFNMQASYDGAEGSEVQGDEPAVESEAAELVEEQIGGQEPVPTGEAPATYQAAGPPAEEDFTEEPGAAAEGAPADAEESAADTVPAAVQWLRALFKGQK